MDVSPHHRHKQVCDPYVYWEVFVVHRGEKAAAVGLRPPLKIATHCVDLVGVQHRRVRVREHLVAEFAVLVVFIHTPHQTSATVDGRVFGLLVAREAHAKLGLLSIGALGAVTWRVFGVGVVSAGRV